MGFAKLILFVEQWMVNTATPYIVYSVSRFQLELQTQRRIHICLQKLERTTFAVEQSPLIFFVIFLWAFGGTMWPYIYTLISVKMNGESE